MRNATRTALVSLLAIVFLISPAPATADHDISLTRSVFEANNIRYEAPQPRLQVFGATERQQGQVDRAIGMFDGADLELPALVIRFSEDSADCDGNLGTYRHQPDGDPAVVTVCTEMRITLIHELAHAWDDHGLEDERRQLFLDHWGLESWNDRDESWYDRGSERAADTIAYTLLQTEPTHNPDILKFVCGFGVLTGKDLPDAAQEGCRGEVVVPATEPGAS